MKDIMVLANGDQIEIEDGGSLGNITHISETEADASATIAKITRENVSHVQFLKDGNVYGEYENMILAYRPIRQEEEVDGQLTGRILVMFSLREQTDVELRLSALEDSQALQDGAIEDIADVVSELAEG